MDLEDVTTILASPPTTTSLVRWWEGLAALDPGTIIIPEYQMTTVDQKQIESIVGAGWRQERSGPLLISHREGRNYVYVGRHRLLAIRQLLRAGRLPSDFRVECVIHEMTLQQEMDAFHNAVERKRYSRESFVNGILTGSAVETAVSSMANQFGFFHIDDPHSQEVDPAFRYRCAQELLQVYRSLELGNDAYRGPLSPQDGPAVLAVVLHLHSLAWAPRAAQARGNIVRRTTVAALREIVYEYGSSHMITRYPFAEYNRGRVDMNDLRAVLAQHMPDEWVEITQRAPLIGGEKIYDLMAKLMLFGREYRKTVDLRLWYNRKRRGDNRLVV